MKIINLKISFSKIFLFLIIVLALLLLVLAINYFKNTIFANNEEIIMTDENYTSILKDCHDNLDKYLNKKISSTGYIFKVNDFTKEQFVLARDMIIKEPNDIRIVGFLCKSSIAKDFETNSWIKITGTIKEGNYHGKMPIIEVTSINKITTPNNIYVYPPK